MTDGYHKGGATVIIIQTILFISVDLYLPLEKGNHNKGVEADI